jgi:c-di-GMP-binding flagellar brake protein YcgR
MSSSPSAERRIAQRYSVPARVKFYHDPTQRDFPGRTVDISSSGMLMYVPATVPVHPGQKVKVCVGVNSKPEMADLAQKQISGKIVRVDRNPLLAVGNIAVGVEFSSDQTPGG